MLTMMALYSGCAAPGIGLAPTPTGQGPKIVVDWDARPLPELPFPNDLATRPDPDSATGLRLNLSLVADTELERESRAKLDQMDGFGLFAPITVSFSEPLDLDRFVSAHMIDSSTADDAVFVIDVTPGSPTYGESVPLDFGNGRFPQEHANPDLFFANDTRAHHPSLMFDTVNEDLDGDGLLDPGEDTDNDGILDVANLYPADGDPWQDLMTFYELETNTLIVRPIIPLREETIYAVVLTNRLVDSEGQPVQSPWAFINHTRQTEALQPLLESLPEHGLTLEDVAFTWSFTTGRVTGDLLDLRAGLDGLGPYASLAEDLPLVVYDAVQMREPDFGNPYVLEFDDISAYLADLDVLPGDADFVLDQFDAWTGAMVTGVFDTPFLFRDIDDAGGDWSDDSWALDPIAGVTGAQPQRAPFTCFLPKVTEKVQPPFDVVLGGHGQGGTRFQLMLFAWAINRAGMALCGFDFAGHGGAIDDSDLELYADLIELLGLLPFVESFTDARYRDLDNDGRPDSGADFWVADAFHTRDMMRQTSVDFMAAKRAIEACGTTTWDADVDDDGVNEVSCDWDADGAPDIGGPGARFHLLGASLGGINTTIAAAVEPGFDSTVAFIPGGGLVDGLSRTSISGPLEASVGRLLSPLIIGTPTESGILLEQLVVNVDDMEEVPMTLIPEAALGGRLVVENLGNGLVREAWIPLDGRLRVPIPTSAMNAYEKRIAAGIPHTGPDEGVVYSVPDNAGLGDPLRFSFYDPDGQLLTTVDHFDWDVTLQAVTMEAGSPIVAGSYGLGRVRSSPEVRRLAGVLGIAVEAGDPIAYASHLFVEPFEQHGARPTNILIMPTPGDDVVPISSGFALARAAGMYDWQAIDERYGMSIDAWLIESDVLRGIADVGPFVDAFGEPILFDVDDLDDGTDVYQAPSDAPLRATAITGAGVSALRVPFADPQGSHGFDLPDPTADFDINTFAFMQAMFYLYTSGTEVRDDHCLERADCPDLPHSGFSAPSVISTPSPSERPYSSPVR